jgi:hypothetical protein
VSLFHSESIPECRRHGTDFHVHRIPNFDNVINGSDCPPGFDACDHFLFHLPPIPGLPLFVGHIMSTISFEEDDPDKPGYNLSSSFPRFATRWGSRQSATFRRKDPVKMSEFLVTLGTLNRPLSPLYTCVWLLLSGAKIATRHFRLVR